MREATDPGRGSPRVTAIETMTMVRAPSRNDSPAGFASTLERRLM
jgi:hypothetical protein